MLNIISILLSLYNWNEWNMIEYGGYTAFLNGLSVTIFTLVGTLYKKKRSSLTEREQLKKAKITTKPSIFLC